MTEVEFKTYARRLFVELFVQLSDDHPRFQREETALLLEEARKLEVETAIKLLQEGNLLPAQLGALVKLHALDQFLGNEAGRRFITTPTQVTLDGAGRYYVYRRPPGTRRAPIESQLGHLRRWLTHHWIIPEKLRGYTVELLPPNEFLNTRFETLRRARVPLKVAIAHFEDGVELEWRDGLKPHLQAVDLKDPEKRWAQVEALLREALQRKVHVLVFPELTITPELRRRVQRWLRDHFKEHSLVMVLPGSFHEVVDASQPSEVFNRSQLLDGTGRVVMEHRKFTTFTEQGSFERIALGGTIKLLPLPIGLLVIPICLDFCQSGQPIREIWKALGPEWLLVPALGNESSMNAHRAAARELRISHGTRTVLANQPRGEGPARGFIGDPTPSKGPAGKEEQAEELAPAFQVRELDIWPAEAEPEENNRGSRWVN